MEVTVGERRLRLVQGDITTFGADAIVNAANAALAGGGGVDGAIHRAGGRSIMQELNEIRARIGRCPTGSAVVTGAGNLPARFVFHAVGPVYEAGKKGQAELLESCYRTCLELANERGVGAITFPSISTGAYGYPVEEAAAIAMRTVVGFLERTTGPVREVTFVLFDRATLEAYEKALVQVGL